MFFCLHIGGQKQGVENRVYGLLGWEVQLICHRGDNFFDSERSVSPWG